MRPLFRAITWRERIALGWRRAREWWRDRQRLKVTHIVVSRLELQDYDDVLHGRMTRAEYDRRWSGGAYGGIDSSTYPFWRTDYPTSVTAEDEAVLAQHLRNEMAKMRRDHNAGARVADDCHCQGCGKRGVRGYCGNCQ